MSSQNATWLAIFLPRLATDRLISAGRTAEDKPLAVYAKAANAFVLTGVSARASALGLKLAMSLADARAIYPGLETVEAEPHEDARLLDAIAAWCERFTPVVAVDAPDGLFLDISGCGHLFGGDETLRDEIVTRLEAQGFDARAALGATPAAAWALARFGGYKPSPPLRGRGQSEGGRASESARSAIAVSPDRLPPPAPSPQGQGGMESLLSPLPIEALRLEQESAALLRRLGLKTIGQLFDAPRSAFTARAGIAAMRRLDQALGRAPEALSPRRPAPPVFTLRRFLEPLFNVETMLIATETLCEDIVAKLDRRGVGARRCALHLFGVDRRDREIEIGLSRPERNAKALLRLFREKLNIAAENLDAEFGIEAMRLDIVQCERMENAPRALVAGEDAHANAERIAAIADVLAARLGPKRVLRAKLNEAHAPEQAGGWGSGLPLPLAGRGQRVEGDPIRPAPERLHARPHSALSPARGEGGLRRPLTFFSRQQPIDAIAAVPDGPPIRFRWRRVLREVARAEGPERIAGDWLKNEPTRDFYRVEDTLGRRYWLYREGLYGDAAPPRWFVAGLMA
jgi:protein ImuB